MMLDRRIVCWVILLVAIVGWLVPIGMIAPPVWAAPTENPPATVLDRPALTVELLQERLRHPIQSDGMPVIDLRRFVIDLRSDNASFRDQFYRLVQAQLQRPGTPIGLDLSNALIQGDFQISQLGLRMPLFGQALSPIFTSAEQAQLQRDRRRLSRLSALSQSLLSTASEADMQTASLQITVFRGIVKLTRTRFTQVADFSNTFFLNQLEAQGTQFLQLADWSQTRFSRPTSFAGASFSRDARFRSSIFFDRAAFDQAQFQGSVNFQSSEFQSTANFNRATFAQPANFTRVQWLGNADFAQTIWQREALFNRSRFSQALFLPDAVFEQAAMFREVQFDRPVNLRGTTILDRADFGYAGFSKGAYLNVPGLRFDSDHAKIVGNPGQIGRVISVPTLQGNENLLRELVRNFRRLEQIADANELEYTRERLRLKELRQQVFGTNLNAASLWQLEHIGFSSQQASVIVQQRSQQRFRNLTEILALPEIDLATYINVRDRVIAKENSSPSREAFDRVSTGLYCMGLSLLLLLSRYGSDFRLVFAVGLLAIAYFRVVFWCLDRWRRLTPQPILPTVSETIWVLSGFTVLSSWGLTELFRQAEHPWLALTSLGAIVVLLPSILLIMLYYRGRYHPLMDVSYFMEEGTLRQLRIVIGRLPIIPRFEDFRKRYLPILWDRRWNWLNYFDFSLNNLMKLGFNDIRLRDTHLPGLITALVWYQWSLGILYIALALWTLSRTIPGLNLLIYFR
jgi:hypothetical protein